MNEASTACARRTTSWTRGRMRVNGFTDGFRNMYMDGCKNLNTDGFGNGHMDGFMNLNIDNSIYLPMWVVFDFGSSFLIGKSRNGPVGLIWD